MFASLTETMIAKYDSLYESQISSMNGDDVWKNMISKKDTSYEEYLYLTIKYLEGSLKLTQVLDHDHNIIGYYELNVSMAKFDTVIALNKAGIYTYTGEPQIFMASHTSWIECQIPIDTISKPLITVFLMLLHCKKLNVHATINNLDMCKDINGRYVINENNLTQKVILWRRAESYEQYSVHQGRHDFLMDFDVKCDFWEATTNNGSPMHQACRYYGYEDSDHWDNHMGYVHYPFQTLLTVRLHSILDWCHCRKTDKYLFESMMDMKHMNEFKKMIKHELMQELYKPWRIQKWIESGNNLEEYLM